MESKENKVEEEDYGHAERDRRSFLVLRVETKPSRCVLDFMVIV